jgi:hypothetical protein
MNEIWIHTLTIILSNFALMLTMFLWVRSEANADRRDIANKLSQEKAETTRMMFDLTSTMIAESKDFHSRMCVIEERNKNK